LLFGVIQTADALTTAFDRAKGAVEAMPISAWVLDHGGVTLFWTLKLALVAAVALVVLITTRWVQSGRPAAEPLHRLVMTAVQLLTVLLAITTLQNALLFSSLS
jgi:hypothetical protein